MTNNYYKSFFKKIDLLVVKKQQLLVWLV